MTSYNFLEQPVLVKETKNKKETIAGKYQGNE